MHTSGAPQRLPKKKSGASFAACTSPPQTPNSLLASFARSSGNSAPPSLRVTRADPRFVSPLVQDLQICNFLLPSWALPPAQTHHLFTCSLLVCTFEQFLGSRAPIMGLF